MNGKNKHITLEQVYDWNNLELAYKNARKGKSKHYGVRKFERDTLGNHNGLSKSDGTEGLGIGLYPVQLLVNFYFSDQDRHTAELGVRVFRYCDNTVILSLNIENLKKAIEYQKQSSKKLYAILHEQIGIQVLSQRNPIDFIGYKFYPDKILVRDDIKQRFKRKFKSIINISALGAYKGWLMHCNANRLWKCITGFNSYNYDTRK